MATSTVPVIPVADDQKFRELLNLDDKLREVQKGIREILPTHGPSFWESYRGMTPKLLAEKFDCGEGKAKYTLAACELASLPGAAALWEKHEPAEVLTVARKVHEGAIGHLSTLRARDSAARKAEAKEKGKKEPAPLTALALFGMMKQAIGHAKERKDAPKQNGGGTTTVPDFYRERELKAEARKAEKVNRSDKVKGGYILADLEGLTDDGTLPVDMAERMILLIRRACPNCSA